MYDTLICLLIHNLKEWLGERKRSTYLTSQHTNSHSCYNPKVRFEELDNCLITRLQKKSYPISLNQMYNHKKPLTLYCVICLNSGSMCSLFSICRGFPWSRPVCSVRWADPNTSGRSGSWSPVCPYFCRRNCSSSEEPRYYWCCRWRR